MTPEVKIFPPNPSPLPPDPNRDMLHPNAAADFLTGVLPSFFKVP